MKTFTKALVGTVAAGAMAVSAAAPAFARDGSGIDAGTVIAGALVIGGIAAVVAATSNNNDNGYRYDRDRDDRRGNNAWNRGRAGNANRAVQQCVAAAERNASRYSYGRANVTDVRKVKQTRYGYEVRGRIAVNSRDRNARGYDSGSFKCRYDGGRIVDLDYSGIRGL